MLTTEQAAQLVGVSRPYMVKLLDSGAVELHMMAGNRRRVRRSAVTRCCGIITLYGTNPMDYNPTLNGIAELPSFIRLADKLLSQNERSEVTRRT